MPLTTAFFLIQKGNTALHIASLAGHLNIVNLLVENGAKYDVQAHVSYHGNRSIDKPKRVLKECVLIWVEMDYVSFGCVLCTKSKLIRTDKNSITHNI